MAVVVTGPVSQGRRSSASHWPHRPAQRAIFQREVDRFRQQHGVTGGDKGTSDNNADCRGKVLIAVAGRGAGGDPQCPQSGQRNSAKIAVSFSHQEIAFPFRRSLLSLLKLPGDRLGDRLEQPRLHRHDEAIFELDATRRQPPRRWPPNGEPADFPKNTRARVTC